MQEKELILIIDFYGQYNQLIARRVRECNVYSEIVPFNTSIEKIKEKNPKGIIFTGGPASVYAENAPKCTKEIFELGIPVLGICYGMQLMTHMLGGKVQRADKREYGVTSVNINNSSKLFKGFEEKNDCLMSHTDFVEILPEGFENIGATEHCPNAAMQNVEKNFYQRIADAALAQIGVYQDCTMLVTNSLAAVGINFHGAPAAYLSLGPLTNNPVPGDICVYQGHVALYIGNGQAVHGGWFGNQTTIYSVECNQPFIGYVHVNR